jgi:pimeloyl-ACP methyl ester carboxylesterase
MALLGVVVVLALLTQLGVYLLQRNYPQAGVWVEVEGARLNVVDLGPRHGSAPPIVMIHGASSNSEAMRRPLGDLLARRHRVILIDRPGHGWSSRARAADSTPAIQARMIAEALRRLAIGPAILVVHSWSGALGIRMALDHPERLAGLIMLAPVTHPWRGGVGWYNKLVTRPLIGPLLAYTITLPLGVFLAKRGAHSVFLPQAMPDGFVKETATALVLRPREFLANARDLMTLKQSVSEQVPRYGEIKIPITIVAGDADATVSTAIHSRAFARAVPHAKLVVLQGIGHMVQQVAPEVVMAEVETMIGERRSRGAVPAC